MATITYMVWTIEFTAQFEKDIKELTLTTGTQWLSELDKLKDFSFNAENHGLNNLNLSRGYRWRKGDIVINFRLHPVSQVLLLTRANHKKQGSKSVNAAETSKGTLSSFLSAIATTTAQTPNIDLWEGEGLSDVPVSIEAVLVDVSDLYLLSIPAHYHQPILECANFAAARARGIPAEICERLEEYIRSPSQHQIGRIYSLKKKDSLASVASEPLRNFLAVLDPQQQSIVEKSISGGPLLIRGGPGTGKTLINLARIIKISEEEESKGLLETRQLRVGFITFNKALSLSAQRMYQDISKNSSKLYVEFKTLDSIIYHLGKDIYSSQPEIATTRHQMEFLTDALSEAALQESDPEYMRAILQRRGATFILEEFEQVIIGNNLLDVNDYIDYPRKGRRTPLQSKERTAIHEIFKMWLKALRRHNYTTFALRRLKILREMEKRTLSYPTYDFLFVDELQDLSVVAIRIVTRLVSDIRFLTFTADTAQSIYLKSPSWSGIYPDLRFHVGNSFILRNSYRMTRQIAKAIQPLRLNAGDAEREDDGINNAVFSGELPYWIQSPADKHLVYTSQIIKQLVTAISIHPGQIAVMVPDSRLAGSAKSQLNSAGIAAEIVNRSNAIDLDAPHVHILTPHAAKGLEFPFVFAVCVTGDRYPQQAALQHCMDEFQQSEEMEKARRLLYVALSRAARGLWMFTDSRNPCLFLADLDQDDWNRQILN